MARLDPNPPRRRPVSLRRRFLWLLAGVVGLFIAGMTLSVILSLRANQAAEERLLQVEAKQMQASVIWRWTYYQDVIGNLARDPQLIDLLLVASSRICRRGRKRASVCCPVSWGWH